MIIKVYFRKLENTIQIIEVEMLGWKRIIKTTLQRKLQIHEVKIQYNIFKEEEIDRSKTFICRGVSMYW